MPHEVELKLLIAPADVPRLQRHPLLQTHTQRRLPTQRLLSIYYDTPELTLQKSRIAVRLRKIGRRWVQTVKTEGRVTAGLHERPEWECETKEHTLDFEPLTDPTLQEFFADTAVRRALRPVFVTEFSRAHRLLSWPNGDVVEFALDRGEIRTDDRRQPICEIELELKAGATERLFACAAELQATIPLQPSNISKAERGYRLVSLSSVATTLACTPQELPMTLPRFHLAFPVNDLAATRRFYVELLGCAVGRESEAWIDFDFFGHQITAHLSPQEAHDVAANPVDGDNVPVRHFGAILEWEAWHTLADTLRQHAVQFVIQPHIRFQGEPGEQATMFIHDPSGNALEFKSFQDMQRVFAR